MRGRKRVEVTQPETVDYRGLTKGREVKVRGARGKFYFQSARTNKAGEVEVTVHGGPLHHERTRVFVADRIVVRRSREVRP